MARPGGGYKNPVPKAFTFGAGKFVAIDNQIVVGSTDGVSWSSLGELPVSASNLYSKNGIRLATLGEGEIFGERGPSLDESRSVSAEASTNCILYPINEKTIKTTKNAPRDATHWNLYGAKEPLTTTTFAKTAWPAPASSNNRKYRT